MTDFAVRPTALPRFATWLAPLAAGMAVAAILFVFHDRFWYPPDEGAYAWVARSMLRGAVLHRDIQDIHAGYVNVANAAALYLFGDDLLSLRYPLVAMGLAQAAIAFLLFRERGPWTGASAAIALTGLSTVNYLNPSAHWYALFLGLVVVYAAATIPREARWRLEILGFLVALVFLFRQLTGVFVAMGLVAWLLYETPARGGQRPILARVLVVVLALGLLGYLVMTGQPTNFLIFAPGPMLVLAALYPRVGMPDRAVLAMAARLMLGGLLAALPLALYLARHGIAGAWIDDVVLASAAQTRLGFIATWFHLAFLVEAAKATASLDPVATVNGLFWLALLALPLANGLLLFRAIRRGDPVARHPLPFLALFYALVALHNQNTTYLFFAAGPVALGFLWLAAAADRLRHAWPCAMLLAMALTALAWQAATPSGHRLPEIVRGLGARQAPVRMAPPASLRVGAEDAARYRALLDLIARETAPGEAILALPNDPELYYLADRPSAARFFNSGLGLRDGDAAARFIAGLAVRPPALVLHDPGDKYNTAESDAVMAYVRSHYAPLGRVGGIDVYRRAAKP